MKDSRIEPKTKTKRQKRLLDNEASMLRDGGKGKRRGESMSEGESREGRMSRRIGREPEISRHDNL